VLFLKQMAHHLVELDRGFLRETVNLILTRDPEQMLPSLIQQLPEPHIRDTGLAMQSELLKQLHGLGQDPPVLDSRELLLDPEGVLSTLCERIGIAFDRGMLSWPAGPKPEDGVWAPYWYQNVRRSTGFMGYSEKTEAFPDRVKPLLEECRPHYEFLLSRAIRARTANTAQEGN
jgi:hypothetical protein